MATPEHRLHAVEDVAEPAADEARARLEQWYSTHGRRVYAICVAVLRDRHEAEDAAQQVFVSALRALLRGARPRDPGAWLAAIARNESWARARRQPAVPLQPDLRDTAHEDPSTLVVQRAELERVWRMLGNLPASQRNALLLREVRGLGYDELVSDLQLSRHSVRSLLNRARRALRDQRDQGAAALTGAPWLTVFGRVFADASTPVLSSASRAAAVGLGAVAITGGAVVAPSVTGHAPQRRVAQPARSLSVSRTSPPAAVHPVAVASRAPRRGVPGRLHDHHGSRRGSGVDGRGGSDAAQSGGRSRDDDSSSVGGSASDPHGVPSAMRGRDTSGADGGSGAGPRSGDDAGRTTSGDDGSGDTSEATGTVAPASGDTGSADDTQVTVTASSGGSSGSSGESGPDGGSSGGSSASDGPDRAGGS
jgi:RNA polymerase sigma-70 factor (ECF subfamily)